jgi:WD40 repeat protein
VVVAHPEGVSVTPGVWQLGGYVHFFGEPALELRLTVEVDRPEQLPMSTTILHGLAPVTAFDIDPGGLYAATGTTEGLLTLWSVDSGQQLARVVGEREPAASPSLNALAFSPDGRWLASIGASVDVRLWSVPGLVLGSELIGHRDAGFWVGVSPDGERIASASLDGDVRVWDRRTGATVHVLDWREAAGDSPRFAYAPRGGGIMFAATRRGGVMGMLSDGVGRLQYAQPVDLSRITAFARSPGGEFVTAGDDEGRILVWSTL